MFSYSYYIFRKFLFLCWIKKLWPILQVADIAYILVAEKIKYWQFALCLHLVAIDLHCYLTCSMCIISKQSPVFKKRTWQRKKHGTRIAKVCFSNFILCTIHWLFINIVYFMWFWHKGLFVFSLNLVHCFHMKIK